MYVRVYVCMCVCVRRHRSFRVYVCMSDLQESFEVLKEAAFPKRLRWRRLVDLSEDLTIQVQYVFMCMCE